MFNRNKPRSQIVRCCAILGITPPASPEEVRQAYRDLVQVWHPDRFTHNARLQKKAEARMREINQAYEALHDGVAALDTPRESPAPPRPPAATPPPRRSPRTGTFPQAVRVPWTLSLNWHVLAAASLLALFIIGAIRLIDALPPVPLPAPLEFIPKPSLSAAAAHALDDIGAKLPSWRTEPAASAVSVPPSPTRPPQPPARAARRLPNDAPVQPPNGADQIDPRGRPGAGSISLENRAELDCSVTLTDESRRAPLRMVYLRAGGDATIGGIGPGMYLLSAQFGRLWRQASFTFAESQSRATPVGPLRFEQIEGEGRIQANHYDVVLRPR